MTKNKNILIISPFFYPEPISTGKFNTDMVVKLKDLGHNITVLCSHPFYPDWKVKKSNEPIDGVKIIRGGSGIKYSKKTFVRRIVLEIWYAFFIIRNIRKYQKKSDIVIPIFPPSLAFYCIVPFLKKKIERVGIVHDLQLIYSSQKKGLISKIASYLISKVEKKCFKSCDKLIFLSEEMRSTSINLYKLEENKLSVQLPFVTVKDSVHTNDLSKILPPNQYNIVYSGALSEKQNPYELYSIFDYLTQEIDNCQCFFFSQGPIFEKLKKNKLNDNIQFNDLVSKENIEELYQRSSIQFIPQLPHTSKGSLPSKLPNILASGTKVLMITDKNSEIEKLFVQNNLDKVITSWDKEIILQSVKELLGKKTDIENQKTTARKLFSIDNMVHQVIS